MKPITNFNPADLTKEKSLAEIYRSLRTEVREQPSNLAIGAAWSLAMALNVFLSTARAGEIAASARALAETGISFASSILGFLLAGFTIFATLSKTDLLLALATVSKKEGGLSYLKLNYFALIEVFIHYIVFVIFCVSVRMFCVPHSGLAMLVDQLPTESNSTKQWLAKIVLWLLSSAFFWIILKLKSFIFNVYHIVMTGVRWDAENAQDAENIE